MEKEIKDEKIMDNDKSKKTVKKKTAKKKVSAPVPNDMFDTKTFSNLKDKFLFVRVGNDSHPAEPKDIKEIEDKLVSLFEENNVDCLAFVTHHAVDITVI